MAPLQHETGMLDGQHAVRFGDGIALLDVAADRYACLYDPSSQADAYPLPDTRQTRPAIMRSPADSGWTGARWQDLPCAPATMRMRDVARFLLALTIAAVQFRRRDFAGLIGGSGSSAPARPPATSAELAIIVARFERMALYLPFRILCLFRSFLLLRFLRLHGHTADWVFGVTLFPFRAHCWLAQGDLLLGETADRASRFSPILIVEA